MICTLAVVAALQSVHIVEAVMPGERFVCVQAVALLPPVGPRTRAALEVLAECIAEGTREYTPGQLLLYALQGGDRIRCSVSSDSIQVKVTLPAGQLANAAALLESVLRRPTLNPDLLARVAQAKPFVTQDPWDLALHDYAPDFGKLQPGDVEEVRRRVFQPSRVWIAAAGGFKPGEAREALAKRFGEWTDDAMPRPFVDGVPVAPSAGLGGVAVHTLVAPTVPSRDVALPQTLLAIYALGAGKGSSMHRVVREKLGLSYRQEALLRGMPEGFSPRFLFARTGHEGEGDLLEKVRAALLDDVKAWGERDRVRALGVAKGVLAGRLPLDPLSIGESGPAPPGVEGRAFLAAYWPMKTGAPYDQARLAALMSSVRLVDLKEDATTMLTKAK